MRYRLKRRSRRSQYQQQYRPNNSGRFSVSVKRGLRRFLRKCYKLGAPTCVFIGSVAFVLIVAIIVAVALPGKQERAAEAATLALETPVPTIVPQDTEKNLAQTVTTSTATPEPTPDITLQKGDDNERVTQLQQRLMALGYLDIDEPTTHFGNATKYALQLFQRQHELQQDGIAGAETQMLLYSDTAKAYVMYEGAEGNDIKSFQEMLVELGYLEDNQVTGYYGTDTVSAVTKFQHRNHLSEDGKAGTKTLETINSDDARESYTKQLEIEAAKKKAAEEASKTSVSGRIDRLISAAKKQIGKPYILGDKGPDSYDCSGLVYYCLRQAGVYTRRLNASGFSRTSGWTLVSSMSSLKKGDLIFFKSDESSSVGHVGIYIGSGTMIDASSASGKVVKRSCTTSYWKRNFVCARRPID